uniref:Uncharacterized protein n=1 Tax=Setaria viridis TaxID=4556 RepID=A0A4V6DCC2_SETVI|nr:hypothetical protein SEVIR_1G016200v2 [Setaria viridis]
MANGASTCLTSSVQKPPPPPSSHPAPTAGAPPELPLASTAIPNRCERHAPVFCTSQPASTTTVAGGAPAASPSHPHTATSARPATTPGHPSITLGHGATEQPNPEP